MTTPIDLALERIMDSGIGWETANVVPSEVRAILTDLAAEVRAEMRQEWEDCELVEDEIPARLPDYLYLSEVWRTDNGTLFVMIPNAQPRVRRMAKYRNEFALGTPAEARLAAVAELFQELWGIGQHMENARLVGIGSRGLALARGEGDSSC